jgi:hypothetical protein
MVNKGLSVCLGAFLSVLVVALPFSQGQASQEASEELAIQLALLLKSGREVVSEKQVLINDPSGGPKDISGSMVAQKALQRYFDAHPDASQHPLSQELANAMQEVVDENLPSIEAEGVGFKGFVPATFARLTVERFNKRVGAAASMKVTAPLELVRNARALPDAFEERAIEDILRSEVADDEYAYWGMQTIDDVLYDRVLVPEYYTQACLACHGSPKGELDVTGYPMEGGQLGQLGGVVSVKIRREGEGS